MKKISIAIILFIALSVSGCATFRYGDKTFSNIDSALNEQQRNLTSILEQIIPNNNKFAVCKNALFIIPDYAAISEKSVTKSRLSTPEVVDYVTKATYNDLQFMVDCVIKYNLFEKIELIESGSPQNTAKTKFNEYEIIIYYKVNNPKNQGWELVSPQNSNSIEKLAFDSKIPAGIQRTEKWLVTLHHKLELLCQ